MTNIRLYVLLLSFFSTAATIAQPSLHFYSREEYIDKYKDEAITQMMMYGIPASITMAQALLESDDGNSPLAKYANNHFGIKCHKDWNGITFNYDDDAANECFRKYSSVIESYYDHSLFLHSRRWYAELFSLSQTDYKSWAYGLKRAGYATEPRYAELLLDIIEKNNLSKLDHYKYIPIKEPKLNISYAEIKKSSVKNENRVVLFNNNSKYVESFGDETIEYVACELKLNKQHLLKYNELTKDTLLGRGFKIYLEPKKTYCNKEFYIADDSETMYDISQQFGLKEEHLYKLNRMKPGTQPKFGQRIYLAYRKPRKL